jgi:hypothetical protein
VLKNTASTHLVSSCIVKYIIKGVLPEIELGSKPANLLGSSVTVRYALKGVLPGIEIKNLP